MPERVNIREYVEKLKSEGILQKIQKEDFNEQRAVFIPCGDMDRYDDWYSHMEASFGPRSPFFVAKWRRIAGYFEPRQKANLS